MDLIFTAKFKYTTQVFNYIYSMYELQFLEQIQTETKRRLFEESISRVKKCLSLLTTEQIWQRPNASLVSIGNLTLHCAGNARQWIGSALGGLPDNRQRDHEFETTGKQSAEELSHHLDILQTELEAVIFALKPEDLLKSISVQGFNETGLGILIHVMEHFSYHVGQISWHTKLLLNTDLKYYGGKDLNITGPA